MKFTLLKRKLIAAAGHKNAASHARLYKTTRQFPIDFGLKDGKELPALEEFAKLRAALRTEPPAASQRLHRLTRLPRPSPKALRRSQLGLHARTSVAATFASGRNESLRGSQYGGKFTAPLSLAKSSRGSTDIIDPINTSP